MMCDVCANIEMAYLEDLPRCNIRTKQRLPLEFKLSIFLALWQVGGCVLAAFAATKAIRAHLRAISSWPVCGVRSSLCCHCSLKTCWPKRYNSLNHHFQVLSVRSPSLLDANCTMTSCGAAKFLAPAWQPPLYHVRGLDEKRPRLRDTYLHSNSTVWILVSPEPAKAHQLRLAPTQGACCSAGFVSANPCYFRHLRVIFHHTGLKVVFGFGLSHFLFSVSMSDTESYVYDSDSDEDYVYDGDGDGEGAAVAFPTTAPALLRQNSANIGTSGDVADAMDKVCPKSAWRFGSKYQY